jgi:Domain of unknown function (DUF4062)/TIR domain
MANVVQVFVSSTQVDLLRERRAAETAIRSLDLHFTGMEYFGARANRSIETCLEEVQGSDIFVLIIGSRYGSYVPNTKISFTEREYVEAESLSKPCLVFFKKSAKTEFVETDAAKQIALERFKQRLRERWQIAEFGDSPQLAIALVASLSREVRRLDQAAAPVARFIPALPTISNELNALIGDVVSRGVPRERLLGVATEEVRSRLFEEASRPPTVFISHLEAESDLVQAVTQLLRDRGIKVLGHPIPSNHDPGWRSTFSEVIGSLDCFVPVISRASIDNRLGRVEREQAILVSRILPDKFLVVPIRVDDTSVPAAYRDNKVFDLAALDIDALVGELAQILSNSRNLQSVNPAK